LLPDPSQALLDRRRPRSRHLLAIGELSRAGLERLSLLGDRLFALQQSAL
jgi:hypothetical protein